MPQAQVGERRKFGDKIGEWDGSSWLEVTIQAEPAPAPQSGPRMPAAGRGTQFQQPSRERISAVADALPAVGGAVGGVMGAPAGPVGSIAMAGLGGAAGEAARQGVRGVQRAFTGEQPEGVDTGALVTQGAVQGGAQAIGAGATKALGTGGRWLMQHTVRANPALLKEFRTTAGKIAETLLEKGINVTEGGLQKLQGLITATNDEIKSMVAAAPGAITKKNVAARVAPIAMRVGRQTNPVADLNTVGNTVDEFLNHPVYKGDLSPADAHAMKLATYQKLGKSYGEMKGAEIEAQKALARGLKEEVADAVPGVAAKNAEEARLLAAGGALTKRIALDSSADPLGLLFAASNPSLFIAGLINRQPVIKSMLARGMYNVAAKAAGVPENVIRSAVFAVASGQEDEK